MGLLISRSTGSKSHCSLLQKLAQYEINDVKKAYSILTTRNAILGKYVDCTTMIQVLPFGISTSYILMAIFENGDHQSVDWRACLGGLSVCVQGSSQSKLHLLFQMYQLLGCPVCKETLRLVFAEVLVSVERLYRTDLRLYEGTQHDVFFNVDATVNNVVDELFSDDKACLLTLEDLQDWAEHHPSLTRDMLHFDHDKNSPVLPKHPSVVGSSSKPTNHAVAYKWNPVVQGRSQPRPSSRSQHAACVYGGNVYVHGGRHGNLAHKDLWRFDIATNKWQKLETTGDRPMLLQQHTMVAYKGKIYAFGGEFSYGPTDETPLWILHLDSLCWEKFKLDCEVMVPCGRRGHTAVVCHHAMHVYGGYQDLMGSNSELWSFDFEQQMWHLAYSHALTDDGPGARHDHSAIVHDNAMWVYGGMTALQPRGDLWRWNFSVRNWTRVKFRGGPPELSGHSACKVHDSMLLFGGYCEGQLYNDIWKFHFASQSWQKIQCDSIRPSPRTRHCMVGIQPIFLQTNDEGTSDRSQSLPQLGFPDIDDVGPRPSSSPAVGVEKLGRDHMFCNKILPAKKLNRLQNPSSQKLTIPAAGNGRCNIKQEMQNSISGQSRQNLSASSKEMLSTPDFSHLSDEDPLLVGNFPHSRTFDDSLCSSSHMVFDNPTFTCVEDFKACTNPVETGHSPSKKYKREYRFSDYITQDIQSKTKSASVDSLVSYSSVKSQTVLQEKEFTKTAKSGSLESLLNDMGGVKVTCVNMGSKIPDILMGIPCSHRDNDLVLEDVEEKDLIDLDTDLSPVVPQKQTSLGLELEDLESEDMHELLSENLPCGKLINMPKHTCDIITKNCIDTQNKPSHGRQSYFGDWSNNPSLQSFETNSHILAAQKFSDRTGPCGFQGTACEMSNIENSRFDDVIPLKDSPKRSICSTSNAEDKQQFQQFTETAFMPEQLQESSTASVSQNTNSNKTAVRPRQSPSSVPKRNPIPDRYCFFLFGGREAEAQNLYIKPLSVWKLEITYGPSGKH